MGFSLAVAKGSYSLVAVHGLLIAVASLVAEDRHTGFSSFSTWAQELWLPGSRAQAQ